MNIRPSAGGLAAIGSAFARGRRRGRIACAVTAGFVAALATSWLIMAGSASSSLTSAAGSLLAAAPASACVPYWFLSPAGDRNDMNIFTWSGARSASRGEG